MKPAIFLTCFILLSAIGWAQHTDSLPAAVQTIELSASTPQPRINEPFKLSIDIGQLKATIFQSLAGKLQLSNDISTTEEAVMTVTVNAVKKGKNEIGPLAFYLDKTKYISNSITVDVIDPLPNVDKGVWVRKVMTSDTTFCIIFEQRIPANSKATIKPDHSITYTTEPVFTDIVKFKDSYSITGVSNSYAHSSTGFSSITVNGEERQYMYGFSVYYFTIEDKKATIKITKDKLQNIPGDYQFEDIIIQ